MDKKALALLAIKHAIRELQPSKLIKKKVIARNGKLIIEGKSFAFKGRKAYCIGFGKAAGSMAQAIQKIVRFEKGIISVPKGTSGKPKLRNFEIIEASHPFPGKGSVVAGRKMLALSKKVQKEDLLIVLVSGGGSSLLELPAKGYTLEAIARETMRIMHAGAGIHELNAARKRMSAVKAGKLAAAFKCEIVNLVISDVLGNDLHTIASGPTISRGTHDFLLASNDSAVDLAAQYLEGRGIEVKKLYGINGEARVIGRAFASMINGGLAFVAGGETTVTVKGKGRGGRNQEIALAGAMALRRGILACVGTDGIDGDCDAAGAIVDAKTADGAKKGRGLDAKKYLRNNDSYSFFKKAGGLIILGHTGTNANDLAIGLP